MTLGNMRANGVPLLAVSCLTCHHETVINASRWPDDAPGPSFGRRMVARLKADGVLPNGLGFSPDES
jgi:hypothetical protein